MTTLTKFGSNLHKKHATAFLATTAIFLLLCFSRIQAQEIDRTVLPPAPAKFKGKIGENYKESTPDFGPAIPLMPPEASPNILVIVLDDVGYGQLGCYGGPIETPNIDKLANSGLRYTNFHTTALCSPTRGVLLTGRNHHSIGLAAITEAATGFPGNFGSIPKSAGSVAETLKQNGYNTMAMGKWHLAPYTSYTAAGPFDRWPLGMGFERYYGFIGGETDQWAPLIVRDNHMVELKREEGYHLTADLVDQTISHIRDQQQANTGRPFFAYLALGAAHAPLHAPKEFIEKYKGRFDQGWDQVRQETFERQKAMGVIAADAVLPPANPGIQAWSEMNDTQRKVYCRLQETFAGFLDHTDHHLGRLLDALETMNLRDDTLVVLISDNGASQEGLRDGTANTDRYRNYYPDTVEEMIDIIDEIGGPSTDPHYPMGWAMAGNSPLKRWKQDTHAGGNTDPFIVSWPAKIQQTGGFRRQYHHVVDVVPTLLELTGLPAPVSVNGVAQQPLPGVSMAYTFDNADAPTRKKVQYYEMLGSRAIWSEGWTAVTWHKKGDSWDDDQWELYNTQNDFTQANDLAAAKPEKLKQLQDLWWSEAKKYNVLPLDDRRYERVADPTRPVASIAKDVYSYYPGTSIVHPLAAPQLLGKPHTVTAFVEIPEGGAEGVLACFGGEFGGWSLYLKDQKLHYVHNYLKTKEFVAVSEKAVPAGNRTLGFRFSPTKSNLKPDYFLGDVQLLIDGEVAGELRGVQSAGQYSAVTGYGLVIGRNPNTSVSERYEAPFEFDAKLDRVTIEMK